MDNLKRSQINFNDRRYLLRYSVEIDTLVPSIKEVGLLNPISVVKKSGKYVIVSGHRRARACKYLNAKDILARILDSRDTTDKKAILINLHDNRLTKSFTDLDRSFALESIRKQLNLKRPEDMFDFALLMGIEKSVSLIELYLKVANSDNYITEAVNRKDLSFQHAVILSCLSKKDRYFIFQNVLSKSFFTTSKLKILLRNLKEVLESKRIGLENLFSKKELTSILNRKNGTKSEKGDLILKHVEQLRYPLFKETQNKFNKIARRLNGNGKIKIGHPKYFENDFLDLNIRVKDWEELKMVLEKISKSEENWKDLFELL